MVTRRTVLGAGGATTLLGGCSQKQAPRSALQIDPQPHARWSSTYDGSSPQFELALARAAAGGRLAWRVVDGDTEMLGWAPLGLTIDGRDVFSGLTFERSEQSPVDDAYPLAHGPRALARTQGRRYRFWFRNVVGQQVGIEVHTERHGVAFRYLVSTATGVSAQQRVDREDSGFRIPDDARLWTQPYMYPWRFGPSYEYYYDAVGGEPITARQVYPLLIERGGRFALVTETGVDGRYSATQLQPDTSGRVLMCDFPLADEAIGEGDRLPVIALPFESPWRMVAVGTLGQVHGTTMVQGLAPPLDARFSGAIPDWIRPGRMSWDWWNDRTTGDAAEQRRYIEAAAEFGWSDVLIDAGWSEWNEGAPDELVRELLAYGAEKGVGIHLWYNSGGPNNEARGQPRDRMHDAPTRRREFARIAALGVRGVKVDFWHSDKQLHIARYLDLLADAADHRLMVNFHGCTLPRGWERRFPNLMTMEAVRGGETYAFPGWYKWVLGDQGPSALDHVRFALIRNIVGSMDYTPLILEAARKAHGISYAHSLALSVVFESALEHCADSIEGYRAHFARFSWMRDLIAATPTSWDETRLLTGHPDSHVVVARRRGSAWHIAGIAAQGRPTRLKVALGGLGAGKWRGVVVEDGAAPDQPRYARRDFAGLLQVDMAASGGFVAVLEPV